MANRCAIYTQIDELSSARTLQELIAKLQPILSTLAFESVAGESSALAYQEEWHQQYTDKLYQETSAASSADARGARARESAEARRESAPRAAAPNPSRGARRPQQAPPSNRSRPGDLPASLAQILHGTHPSLTESDD